MLKKIFYISFAVILIFILNSCENIGSDDTVTFTILQTSDLHNHAAGYGPSLDYTPKNNSDNDSVKGGYTRLASLIANVRNEHDANDNPVVVIDSGDFFMGTIYDLAATDPITLKYFQMTKYDAVTLGNHEFDWSPAGLAYLLSNALKTGFTVPVLASNLVTSETSASDDMLEALIQQGIIIDKKILELPNGLRVGLLGYMGIDSDQKAPVAPPVTFNHDYAFLQAKVDNLRKNDGVDIVILISHGGVNEDGTGDDALIAENVTGIDVIASGHYHVATKTPVKKGASNTLIFSPGEYGEYLSRLDITYNRVTNKIESTEFKLLPVDDTIVNRTVFETVVSGYKEQISAALTPLLNSLGLSSIDAAVSSVSWDMTTHGGQESGIGNLSADGIRAVVSSLAPLNDGVPVQIAVIPNGVIRDGLFVGKTGKITFTDIYNNLPLGTSPDTSQPLPGYPMMAFYVNGPELRNICEAGITLSAALGSDYYLNYSGIRIDYKPSMAPYFQGVQAIYMSPVQDSITSTKGAAIDLTDTTTVYKISVNLYALQMLGVISQATGGLLPINPRDKAGNIIPPAEYMLYRVDYDVAAGVQELKEWMTQLFYLQNFPTGIPSAVYGEGGIGMGRINFIQ